MNIEMIAVEKLIPYENNPRKNDSAVPFVVASIEEFGFKVPMVVTSDYVIVAGHTRYKAAQLLGLSEVPCLIAGDLDEDQIKAYRLADNKTAEVAEWDSAMLQKELDDLYNSIDMNLFGFPVQIENIDEEDLEGDHEPIAVELNEANNYVVMQFYTDEEWDLAKKVLRLQRVATNEENAKVRRHGIGRVIDGREVMEALDGFGFVRSRTEVEADED
ncbi:MAG: ParB N-terminal domain-containing protein [Paludibacteraceae bacterium]|nr:ParB N-terminal domain-containing protein [Paludibacteraceae bacterium]